MEAQAWTRQIPNPAPLTRKRRSSGSRARAGLAKHGEAPLPQRAAENSWTSAREVWKHTGDLGREAGAAWSAGRPPRRPPCGTVSGAAARPAAGGGGRPGCAGAGAAAGGAAPARHPGSVAPPRGPGRHQAAERHTGPAQVPATARQDAAQWRHLEAVKVPRPPPCGGCPARQWCAAQS